MARIILSVTPFTLLLIAIAIIPLLNRNWWNRFYPVISITPALAVILYYILSAKSSIILHAAGEYIMFISVLSSFFIVSGGIFIGLKGAATPLRNVLLLATGAVLANVIGTTGASMLLIRPYIKTNGSRISAFHIIFFIFIVSNIGGMLTPLGPPLLLGYIKGIPFFWFGQTLFLKWIVAAVILLVIFYFIDLKNFNRQTLAERIREISESEKFQFSGWLNVLLMCIIICSVFIDNPPFIREIILLLIAIVSYKLTSKKIHKKNYFNFHPLLEVVWLFIGIFITLAPVLELLESNSKFLPVSSPTEFYWLTGILSSFLDNAPAYLLSLTSAMGLYGLNANNPADIQFFLSSHESHVVGISIAAVIFGAATYVGNGPNFMVKSVADQQGVKTASFLGYIVKYTLPILIPLYALIWWLFIA
jgi:Na+/H+ antiporter NhaD/arsenite permease-like protein